MPRKRLRTWAGHSEFEYSGSVDTGTEIFFGENCRYHEFLSGKRYQALLKHFKEQNVSIGTSRTNPPDGSLGAWLLSNVSRTALASYIGPILLHEGYANRGIGGTDMIQFL